jgi:hypothetical protein
MIVRHNFSCVQVVPTIAARYRQLDVQLIV